MAVRAGVLPPTGIGSRMTSPHPLPHRGRMHTLGVDLAAQPRGTAACVLSWEPGGPRLAALHQGVDDAKLVHLLREPSIDVSGVDVPFGWPVAFVAMIAGDEASFASWTEGGARLRLRATDRYCHEQTGAQPLSVAADRIACPAMRWRIVRGQVGPTVARISEVYPAAALGCWGLPRTGYKQPSQRPVRVAILAAIRSALGLVCTDAEEEQLLASADALDALVAAVVARAVARGAVHPVPPALASEVQREGWIELPTGALAELVGEAS